MAMNPDSTPPPIEALLAHREWLRRVARSVAFDESTADDLEQEVWLAALERPPAAATSLRGWLATVLRRRSANRHRSDHRRGVHERRAARPEVDPVERDLVAETEEARRL